MPRTNNLYYIPADAIPPTSLTDKCIVLDLDQTLIATQDSIDSLKLMKILSDPKLIYLRNRLYYLTIDDLEKPGIGTRYDFWGITRPHVEDFLLFCFTYFKTVAVWSAGKRPYVEAIVDHLFRDLPSPHIVFTFDDIETGPKGEIEKPLTKMIDLNPQINMTLMNTLAIDDNPTTFQRNYGNGVLIPPYEPDLNINSLSQDDPSLLKLKYWLLQPEVMTSRDVSLLNKDKIFTTPLDYYKRNFRT